MPKVALSLLALLVVGVGPAALAQDPNQQPIQTATYTYEMMHLRMENQAGGSLPRFKGVLSLVDITAGPPFIGSSRINALIKETNTGETVLDCQLGLSGNDHDIVQVGPFAQQAHGDIESILLDPEAQFGEATNCFIPPAINLTVDCPFAGVRAPKAPHHYSFTHSGTYVGTSSAEAGNTFSQRGEHGPIHCDIIMDGEELGGAVGHLTFIRENRRGVFIPPEPMWKEPRQWLTVPDLRGHLDGGCQGC